MDKLANVRRYLQDFSAKGKITPQPFITISRQAGAGGRTLAHELVRQMEAQSEAPDLQGWHVYDEEICERIALDPHLKVSLQSLVTEDFKNPVEDYLAQVIAGDTAQIKIYREIFSCVRGLAKAGKAVIVGRGGASLTRRLYGGVHVRLAAPRVVRVHRMMESFKIGKREAEDWIDKQDDARTRMTRALFNRDIDDPLLYDAVFNTATLDFPGIAEAVLCWVKEKARELRRAREVDASA